MRKSFYTILILTIMTVLSISCKEKERELEASPDMLLMVKENIAIIELGENNDPNGKPNSEIKESIHALLMNESIRLPKDYVYEMKLDAAKSLDVYKDQKSFRRGSKLFSGSYSFDKDDMFVTYSLEDEECIFSIEGSVAKIFYNHFVHKEGSGNHHIIEASKVFCLCDDFTEFFRKKYPQVEVKEVYIKTDMIIIRRLETFK